MGFREPTARMETDDEVTVTRTVCGPAAKPGTRITNTPSTPPTQVAIGILDEEFTACAGPPSTE
jgi:hypothetical protein